MLSESKYNLKLSYVFHNSFVVVFSSYTPFCNFLGLCHFLLLIFEMTSSNGYFSFASLCIICISLFYNAHFLRFHIHAVVTLYILTISTLASLHSLIRILLLQISSMRMRLKLRLFRRYYIQNFMRVPIEWKSLPRSFTATILRFSRETFNTIAGTQCI